MSHATALGFRDVTRDAGIDFVHENSPTSRKHLIETMPGGLAVLDYDGDGRLDVFFTNGAEVPGLTKDGARHSNRLYRNVGDMRFVDVTEMAGLRGAGYGVAVAVADYDNDGDPDLYLGGVHRQHLYRNTAGRFEDVTEEARLESAAWVVGAGFFDYDNDGWLDLVAVNYTVWTPAMDRFCGDSARGIRVYCHPKFFEPVPLSLYRNRGDGRFEDVSVASGIAHHRGRGMAVAFADYDQDGSVDFYVTNDKLPSFLFRNRGDGSFEEKALLAGPALPEAGQDISAMGIEFRDYDNDGWPDIHVTALAGESFPLYRNLGKGLFQDVTYRTRLAAAVAARSGWGNGLADFDNDGFKDLFTANSHVNDAIDRFESRSYRETNSVFRNLGDGTFADLSAASGLAKAPPRAHRGAAFGDLDGDGRVDVVVSALQAPAELWRNESQAGHWLALRLVGTKSNRDGIGAVVRITSSGDPRWREQWNHASTAFGYASASAGPLHFGTGQATTIERVEIRWPSGTQQVLENVAADQVLTVRETPAGAEAPPLPVLALDQYPAGLRDRVAAAESRAQKAPESALAAGELGMLLHAYDQLASASAAYERARALDSRAFEWSYLAGVVRVRSGRAAEAVPLLREAALRQPQALAARVRLGEGLLASGEIDKARALYEELLRQHPDLPLAHYGLGRAFSARGTAASAAERYLAATQLFPAYGAAHYALGLAYRDLGRAEDAQRHLRLYQQHLMEAPPLEDPVLESVLRLKQSADAVLAEGVRLGETGDFEGSIREHLRALELDPGLTKAHANLMALYGQAEKWDKVDEHYRAAVAQAPGLVEVHYNYALALQQQKRSAEAQQALARVLALSPHHAPAQNALGALLELEGRLDDAAEQYRLATVNQADFQAARFNLGRVLVELGRPREAVAQFEQILGTEDEQTPLHLYALAVAESRAGEHEPALRHAQEARRKAEARGQQELAALAAGFERELRQKPAAVPR